MQYRPLGTTGLSVSAIAFGTGPVSGLMTSMSNNAQQSVIAKAVELGVNWFDTAATYANGLSESGLGAALASVRNRDPLYVATKVRVQLKGETDLRPLVVASVAQSLERLQMSRVTLLQIHNSITRNRNDQPTSITPEDVLGPQGLLAGMEDVREAGLVEHFGLTGIGDTDALNTVISSGRFATIQAPVHLLNLSALRSQPGVECDPEYGGFLQTASKQGMGIFAIRIFAAGALIGATPSRHTLQTPFFPLALYLRDQARANELAKRFGSIDVLREIALRYVVSHPQITSAIIGLGETSHVEDAARIADMELLTDTELTMLEEMVHSV